MTDPVKDFLLREKIMENCEKFLLKCRTFENTKLKIKDTIFSR